MNRIVQSRVIDGMGHCRRSILAAAFLALLGLAIVRTSPAAIAGGPECDCFVQAT
jgi:hypothetical protein